MLPEFVKHRIELKFGKKVVYHKDCEILARSISKTCDTKISTSTVKRLFGINATEIVPRADTLDIIGRYAGLENWRLCRHGKKHNENAFDINENIFILDNALQNSSLTLAYANGANHILRYLGEHVFKIIESCNSKLLQDDLLTILRIEISYPLVCENVVRKGESLGKFIGKNGDILVGFASS